MILSQILRVQALTQRWAQNIACNVLSFPLTFQKQVVACGSLPSALRVVNAMKQVHRLDKIGYSPSQIDQLSDHMLSYGPDRLTKEDVNTDIKLTEEEIERASHNAVGVSHDISCHAGH